MTIIRSPSLSSPSDISRFANPVLKGIRMWCARCQADVAAEVSPDTRKVSCATCGTEIVNSITNRTESRTRQARALLERWSLERETSPANREESATVASAAAAITEQPAPSTSETDPPFERPRDLPSLDDTRSHRIDAPHTSFATQEPANQPEKPPQPIAAVAPVSSSKPTKTNAGGKLTNWASTAGQWLAYSGILGLMTGTCLVILGYFRGPESYAPTGWLITTAGQMLLFLGVVTLVSSGIEESSNTMTEQISRLDAKLLRIEQATELLRAPHSLSQFNQTTEDAAKGASAANAVHAR